MITCIVGGDPRTDRYVRGCLVAVIAALLLAVAAGGCLITTIVWRFLP